MPTWRVSEEFSFSVNRVLLSTFLSSVNRGSEEFLSSVNFFNSMIGIWDIVVSALDCQPVLCWESLEIVCPQAKINSSLAWVASFYFYLFSSEFGDTGRFWSQHWCHNWNDAAAPLAEAPSMAAQSRNVSKQIVYWCIFAHLCFRRQLGLQSLSVEYLTQTALTL